MQKKNTTSFSSFFLSFNVIIELMINRAVIGVFLRLKQKCYFKPVAYNYNIINLTYIVPKTLSQGLRFYYSSFKLLAYTYMYSNGFIAKLKYTQPTTIFYIIMQQVLRRRYMVLRSLWMHWEVNLGFDKSRRDKIIKSGNNTIMQLEVLDHQKG